jgi:biotin carboxylase
MTGGWFVLVESNTTGSGRLFCASARRLGLRPVLFARDPQRYPYVRADGIDSQVVDTGVPAAVLAACAGLTGPIAGVASSSEYFIATAGEVAAALSLPHPDPAAVRACRDKNTQRAGLRAAGIPVPQFAAARTCAAAVAAAAQIGFPVVVKPVAGSGSIGTRLCTGPDEVAAAASYVLDTDPADLALPPQHAVMVEEYLAGPEYSVETLGTEVVGVTRKHLGPAPFFVETGHDFPAPLGAAREQAICAAALSALRALRLGWGAAHVELRYTALGPRVVEVNPRLAGGMIPRVVAAACGIDMIFHVVAQAAGQPAVAVPTRAGAASIRFLVATAPGRVIEIRGVPGARRLPGVVEVGVDCEPGREVVLTNSFRDRLGYVIAAADDGGTAARRADEGLRHMAVRIAPASVTAEGAVG